MKELDILFCWGNRDVNIKAPYKEATWKREKIGLLLVSEDWRWVQLYHDRVLPWVVVLTLLNLGVLLTDSYNGQAVSSSSELFRIT
jgi:hypothetical protein